MDDVIKFWEWDMEGIESSRRPILVKSIQLSSSILSLCFNPLFDKKRSGGREEELAGGGGGFGCEEEEEEEEENDMGERSDSFSPPSSSTNEILNTTEISCEMITTHQDGTVRRWLKSTSPQNQMITNDDNGGQRSTRKRWTCVSHFQLIPSCPCSLSAFSPDGSLVCLVYENTIFIVDSDTDQVMTTINLSNEMVEEGNHKFEDLVLADQGIICLMIKYVFKYEGVINQFKTQSHFSSTPKKTLKLTQKWVDKLVF